MSKPVDEYVHDLVRDHPLAVVSAAVAVGGILGAVSQKVRPSSHGGEGSGSSVLSNLLFASLSLAGRIAVQRLLAATAAPGSRARVAEHESTAAPPQ